MGVDLGFKRDPTVIYIQDLRNKKIVFVREIKHGTPPQVRQAILAHYREYLPLRTAIDSTGVGMTFVQDLVEEHGLENVEQFVFTAPSKIDILTRLQSAVYQRAFYFPFHPLTRRTIDELSFYRLDDKNIKQDHVMALALMNYAAEEAAKRSTILTEINDNLLVTPVSYVGGYAYDAELEEYEGGVRFVYDADLGILVPDEGRYGGLL
jgi:phage FluMu gp28-like protein